MRATTSASGTRNWNTNHISALHWQTLNTRRCDQVNGTNLLPIATNWQPHINTNVHTCAGRCNLEIKHGARIWNAHFRFARFAIARGQFHLFISCWPGQLSRGESPTLSYFTPCWNKFRGTGESAKKTPAFNSRRCRWQLFMLGNGGVLENEVHGKKEAFN